ncbi:hypothetical protein F5141DRAFT_1067201 [Pisolithus sp. B1]|nr:hypothetical protein F5141DRAFT_1067201 [Pisolithus sp. B1]
MGSYSHEGGRSSDVHRLYGGLFVVILPTRVRSTEVLRPRKADRRSKSIRGTAYNPRSAARRNGLKLLNVRVTARDKTRFSPLQVLEPYHDKMGETGNTGFARSHDDGRRRELCAKSCRISSPKLPGEQQFRRSSANGDLWYTCRPLGKTLRDFLFDSKKFRHKCTAGDGLMAATRLSRIVPRSPGVSQLSFLATVESHRACYAGLHSGFSEAEDIGGIARTPFLQQPNLCRSGSQKGWVLLLCHNRHLPWIYTVINTVCASEARTPLQYFTSGV